MTASLLRSRYVALGVVALLFGTAVLSVNFASEYATLNGETGLTDLPSFRSMLKRTGQLETFNTQYAKQLAWPFFLRSQFHHIGGMFLPRMQGCSVSAAMGSQFHHIGGMFLPYSLTGVVDHGPYLGDPIRFQYILGIVSFCTCLLGLAFVRHPLLWATLVLSGFCWGLPMRHSTAFHDFESLFYIGLPLVLFSLVLLFIHRLSGRRLRVVVSLAVAALVIFVLSTFQMARIGHTAEAAERQKNVMADYDVIRKITAGKVVHVPQKAFLHSTPCSIRYYLTGSIIQLSTDKSSTDESNVADFLISCHRYESAALLTPENKEVFLYRSDGQLDQMINEMIEGGEPLIHAEYRGYVVDVTLSLRYNRLYYVRSPRTKPPEDAQFFLHVIPGDVSDLPAIRKRWGFDNLDFDFDDKRIPHGTRDVAVLTLPDYNVARIITGQYTSEGRLWDAEVSFEEQPDDD